MSFLASLSLRQILALDAASSGGMGALLLIGGGLLEPLLGVPAEFQRAAGALLIPFALFVGWLASRAETPRSLAWTVAAINIVWVIESLATLAGGFIAPTALGVVVVIGQALIVALLAELQVAALRRKSPATA